MHIYHTPPSIVSELQGCGEIPTDVWQDTAALSGTISSGIRSIYCYTPTGRVRTWKPFEFEDTLIPDWVLEQLTELCQRGPFSDGRVTMGFGFDFYFLPKEVLVGIFGKVRELGIKTITSHYVGNLLG